MRLSLDWVADYVELPPELSAEDIAYALTMATVEVEQIVRLAKPLEHVRVARVESVERHPKADRLSVVRCSIGDGKTVEVVCGGTNLTRQQLVALALPGATVRSRSGHDQVAVVEREIHGVVSSGMVCAASELDLEQLFTPGSETNVMDLSELDVRPGQGLAAVIGFDDVVLEIDNRSLTNRPDLLGHRGLARELAAIYARPLESLPRFRPPGIAGDLAVDIEDPSQCRRYTATWIEGVTATPSPFWLRSRLVRAGQRPINLPVDLTNYVMLALGQPSHAFDTEQLRGAIQVRRARYGETLGLLDGGAVGLDENSLVIADERRPVALAGVMGGVGSSISNKTLHMVLEIANFEPSGIRRTASRMSVRTESSRRFDKGLDPKLVEDALALFFDVLSRALPDARATGFVDNYPAPFDPVLVETTVGFINRRLGASHSQSEICEVLGRLGFDVSAEGSNLAVNVPSWRATGDVSLPEDLVEEVGRLFGYENLDFQPPQVYLERAIRQPKLSLDRRVREYLAGPAAMQEIASYPWVEDRYLDAVGATPPLRLVTPPAPTAHRLQSSLIPQMLSAVVSNLRFLREFRLFEMARVFPTRSIERLDEHGERLPYQPKYVAAALVGNDPARLFLEAKGVLESLGREVQMEPLSLSTDSCSASWAELTAQMTISFGEQVIGCMGLVSARTMRLSGIRRARAALFEFGLDLLRPHPSRENIFEPIPTYPQKEYDLSLLIPVHVKWTDLHRTMTEAHELVRSVRLVEEYVGDQVPAGKRSLLVRVTMGAATRTLEAKDVDMAASAILKRANEEFGAELRS